MNQAQRQAAADQLTRQVRALRMAQRGERLALERRNATLRQMKAAGFRLSELRELTGLAVSMLSRITRAKEES